MKKAIVFGTGLIYEIIKEKILSQYNVVAFIDNNQQKWNTKQDGIIVMEPQKGLMQSYDVVIIAACWSIKQIAQQLKELKVSKDNIIIGVNYALQDAFSEQSAIINYVLNNQYNMICNYQKEDEDLINLNILNNKNLLITSHSISVLVEFYNNKNNLDEFLKLSFEYYNNQKGCFLDVGANIGTTSIQAIEYPNVTECIAFEPSSDNYSLLMSNIYLNKLQNKISGYNYAVGDKKGINKLLLSPNCSGDNRLRKFDDADNQQKIDISTNYEEVETIALDEFLKEKHQDIKFVWIDVQGYEYYVLKGAQELIKRSDIAIQIEYQPSRLLETNSLDLLNEFLINNFKHFIDMDDKNNVQDIKNIYELEKKLLNMTNNAVTNIFLIR